MPALPDRSVADGGLRDYQNHMENMAPDRSSLAAALRELEAAKARVERDAHASAYDLRRSLIEKLLPVLDDLDRTIAAAERAGDAPVIVEGTRLVRAELEAVLRGYGLERLDACGHDFDPAVHEAVATVPVPTAQHETIREQLAPGYRFGGTLLRPAQVVVGLQR